MSETVVIADEKIAALYPDYFSHEVITVPSGEKAKTRSEKERIETLLLEKGYGRNLTLIAFGGGSTLDLVGFVAATYCRGVALIYCPTTLLAMVDASIGGKNGINTKEGKNLIGSFYPPSRTILDEKFLQTLPEDEVRSGIVEMLKHGAIISKTHFDSVQASYSKEITASRDIKESVVKEDEFESGLRRILNFGHTVGHAIETLSGYNVKHGAAVAWGAVAEADVARRLGILSEKDFIVVKETFLPYAECALPEVPTAEYLNVMKRDKKVQEGKINIVLLEKVGKVKSCSPVSDELLLEVINDLRCH